MPPLKYILQDAKSDELKSLRGKTIECISLIGLAVGKNKVSYFKISRLFIKELLIMRYSTIFNILVDSNGKSSLFAFFICSSFPKIRFFRQKHLGLKY